MTMPDRVRLPLVFDAVAMAAEVEALAPDAWTAHFNQAIYQGDWSGVALRSAAGRALDRLHCPLTTVRFLALGPGASIAEHRDYWLAFDDGEVRLHIPIVTDPAVEFVLDGRRVDMQAGECWYLNLNRPHQVTNHSAVRRVHLVVDCKVNPWLRSLLVRAAQENCAYDSDKHASDANLGRQHG
jgi:mannose-6-phosphate isomerase-like protein (cupin superfamily)